MKEISLTRGLVTLVDDEDFEYLNQWEWFAHNRRGKFYAARNSKHIKGIKRKCISMHRELLRINDSGVLTDHKDGNSLNNQKSNLRACNYLQNNANSKSRKNSTSKYLGVSFRSDSSKWRASIQHDNNLHQLGTFLTEKEAAIAYNKAAFKLFGEFANLNILCA